MRLYQALCSVIFGGLLGACATQLDESGVPTELASGGDGGNAGTSLGAASGKGGGTSSMSFGGSAGVGGKGGAAGASSTGGQATAGTAGNGGAEDGGSPANAAGADSGAAGAPAATSCAGLPVWMPNAEPPNKPMMQGDELTYMSRKFAVEPEGAMIAWWNDVCPPSGTREMWCETDPQRYTDLGPCE